MRWRCSHPLAVPGDHLHEPAGERRPDRHAILPGDGHVPDHVAGGDIQGLPSRGSYVPTAGLTITRSHHVDGSRRSAALR